MSFIRRYTQAAFHEKLDTWLLSWEGQSLQMLLACYIIFQQKEVQGVIWFAYLLSAVALLCSDVLALLPSFLFTCVFVTDCYDSAALFYPSAVPAGVTLLVALMIHFALYAHKPRIGKSFYPLCAVALATTLGGLGVISPHTYLKPFSLYYIVFLGIGMVLMYLLILTQYKESRRYDVYEVFTRTLYLMGLLAVFAVLNYYVEYGEGLRTLLLEKHQLVTFQASNNLSTFLLIAMPVPFYYAVTRHAVHVLGGLLMFGCIILSDSRGGLLMGTVLLPLCILYLILYDKRLRWLWVLFLMGLALVAARYGDDILRLYGFDHAADMVSRDEARVKLLQRSLKDFASAPLFGIGLTNTANVDVYHPVQGAMTWYHMMLPQIYGSLGLCGLLAWGYQWVTRAMLVFRRPNMYKSAIGLSYVGLLLMSQVNPGEFCPLPYGLLAMIFFLLLENRVHTSVG